ncbi:MAG: adenylate/guanylate cyclase domain-containing protein [Dokdonella sp.]|uniref:adenylate/guanylate cyclase domain-containing protein n=1 Tax=Dokdonella sp. TaxID=2291710 RepID=UPI0025BFE027|nr:adenylate/guanylate cyclase domain-containing protein [Dokdonella sp.]MBZ0222097.1 adenylate/guanylate cyclase domain-containing protein [Dokdonella sp.]MCC7254398.1 adenylate/guanylate cyclase domain-containing protein [Dokdonella sp.]
MTERRALTILFADVSGSTRLFESRGDLEARRLIASVLDALSEVAARHGGRVVKTIGDEIMCTFPSALNGLFAATDMQRRIKHDDGFQRDKLAIRIGLHHGEALVENGDVFGDAVNVAARMADKTLARRDQVVTTASTVAGVTNVAGLRVRPLGNAWVLGKQAPIEIVDVLWQEDLAPVTTLQRVLQADQVAAEGSRLTLRHRGQVFELDESATFSIGRDPASSLVVETEWVSRNHALIEWKRGHFMFADRSTNGSWLRMGEANEVLVHRDEVHLRQSGTISLGQVHGGDELDLLHFQCGEE